MSGCKELVNVGGDEVCDVGLHGDGGVKEGDLAARSLCLREGVECVGLVEEDLTLEIGGFDEVAIDEGEGSDAGAGQEGCGCGTSGSAADDGDMSGGEELLAGGPDAFEEDLARVSVVIGDGGWGSLVWRVGICRIDQGRHGVYVV